ncbi:MAG: hypothetical protein HZB23_14170 [Deltaproteobacteria bacterium]|nr:hypothetical protein [Deltaproteobacteria bacterium]
MKYVFKMYENIISVNVCLANISNKDGSENYNIYFYIAHYYLLLTEYENAKFYFEKAKKLMGDVNDLSFNYYVAIQKIDELNAKKLKCSGTVRHN